MCRAHTGEQDVVPPVAPGETAARFYYGRISLAAGDGPLTFNTKTHETGLICLNGKATIKTGGQTFQLDRYDAVYVPRDSDIEVTGDSEAGCDLAEVSRAGR